MITLSDNNAHVLAPVEQLNYFDSQSINLSRPVVPLMAWNLIMEEPQHVLKLAFWIRDAVSSLFGVKKINGFSTKKYKSVNVGDYLDFFLVEHSAPDALVLTERDRHLDVMTCISINGKSLAVTSSVQVHNWFGHVYMLPVGVVHKIIVKKMLKRLQRKVA